MGWVERIGELYRLNDARLKVRADAVAFATADGALRGRDGFRNEWRIGIWLAVRTLRGGRYWRAWATIGQV